MRVEKGLVPLPLANTPFLRTVVRLPLGLEQKIGVRVPQVRLLCQIGGFDNLWLRSNNRGLGEEVVGRQRSEMVPTVTFTTYSGSRRYLTGGGAQARWSRAEVAFNAGEMERRIVDADQSVRSERVWAEELDHCLRKSLVQAGVRNLVSNLDTATAVRAAIGYSGYLLALPGDMVTSEAVWGIPVLGILLTAVDSIFSGPERKGKGRRISMFIGPELDRALVLATLGSVQRLVQPLAKE